MSDFDFEQMRRAMVANQLRTTGVSDAHVLAAVGTVARERFVPADRRAAAYADVLIPLADGRDLNPPMATARLLSEAGPRPGDRAMVVAAGTGYAAAVLAEIGASVVAVEEDPAIAAAARETLAGSAVTLVEGPAGEGHAKGAPYDLILIDGAVGHVPQPLIDQLADGGGLATAVVDRGVTRLAFGRKSGDAFGLVYFADAAAAVLPDLVEPRTFIFERAE